MIPVINKQETGTNLRNIMDSRNLSAKDVQEYLGLGCVQSVYRWLDGINMPTIDNLYALSQWFGIPIDAIVCGNKKAILPKTVVILEDRRDKRLYTYYKRICEMAVA